MTHRKALLSRLSWIDDYREVRRLYPRQSLWVEFYSTVRFAICPYGRVESVVPRSGVIVDIGCGYGLFANLLAIRCPERQVVGCDTDAARIAAASLSIGDRKNICFFVSDSVPTLPLCDAVTMIDVLHHVPPDLRVQLLQEVVRKLCPGGSLIVKDIDKVPVGKYLWTYALDLLMTGFDTCFFLAETEMCQLLQNLGLTVVAETLRTHTPYSHILYECVKGQPGLWAKEAA
jgi:SAM-dependent methyltransferase